MKSGFSNIISQFMFERTKLVSNIRDHLPAGPEFFKLFDGQQNEVDFYQFIDGIAIERPYKYRIEFGSVVIKFNDLSWKWELVESEDSRDVHQLLQSLEAFEAKAIDLRSFLHFQKNNSNQ